MNMDKKSNKSPYLVSERRSPDRGNMMVVKPSHFLKVRQGLVND